ncbi:MAG: DUF1569 domain-containing protein [Planctomycetota bacterium]|jgi:hypothetical protein
MAKIVLNRETRGDLIDRVNRLQDESTRRWGTMSAAEVFAHLRLLMEISLEERQAPDVSNPFKRTVMKWIAFYALPFPKGVKAPVEFTPSTDREVATERAAFLDAFERFEAAADAEPNRAVPHPFFGPCTLSFWRRIHGTHLDHHLRQFGV